MSDTKRRTCAIEGCIQAAKHVLCTRCTHNRYTDSDRMLITCRGMLDRKNIIGRNYRTNEHNEHVVDIMCPCGQHICTEPVIHMMSHHAKSHKYRRCHRCARYHIVGSANDLTAVTCVRCLKEYTRRPGNRAPSHIEQCRDCAPSNPSVNFTYDGHGWTIDTYRTKIGRRHFWLTYKKPFGARDEHQAMLTYKCPCDAHE